MMTSRFNWLRRFSGLYSRMGVDVDKMIPVMEVKALLLTRSWQSQRQKKMENAKNKKVRKRPVVEKEMSLFNWGKTFGYAFCSLFMMIYGFYFNDPAVALSLTFLICFVMQFLGVITDFPLIILDTKDSTNLATKPIDAKTISAAKSTLAILYMLINSASLYVLIFIPFFYKGLYGVAFMMLFAVVASNFICVALAYYMYGSVLKFFDGEKLKDILSAFQILLTVFIMVGYQFLARVMTLVGSEITLKFEWWHLLVPSYWLTYISTSLYAHPNYSGPLMGLIAFAIVGVLLFVHYTYTGKTLEENLNKMLADGEKKRGFYLLSKKIQGHIAKIIFPKNSEAQAFYLLGHSVAGNDRKMKQIIYPLYVSMLITPIVIFINALQDNGGQLFLVLKEAPPIILSLYFCSFSASSVIMYTSRTANPKGAWIYDVLPIKNISSAYMGSAFSILMKYTIPPMTVISAIFLFLGGTSFIDDLILINLAIFLMALLTMLVEHVQYPFSLELAQNSGKNVALTVLSIVMPLIAAGIHALVMLFGGDYGIVIVSIVVFVANIIAFQILLHRRTEKIILPKETPEAV